MTERFTLRKIVAYSPILFGHSFSDIIATLDKYLYFEMTTVTFLLIFLNFSSLDDTSSDKRLLYHSVINIAQELVKINNKIEKQHLLIQNLTKALSEKDKAIQNLTATVNQLLNLTKSLSDKNKEMENLKKHVEDLQNHKSSGSTFVRWGRTTCPENDTDLVYHGYMASSAHTTTGGGANFLCLSPDPQWSYFEESITSYASIKGVEYEFWGHRADGAAKFFGYDVYNDDAVCAVCHVPRSATLMIPGRTDCYSGWTKEYSGYLVSERDLASHESDFICLDDRPEALVGGKNNDDEGVMYFVDASCGKSLECPPYVNGRELTCVVCSI